MAAVEVVLDVGVDVAVSTSVAAACIVGSCIFLIGGHVQRRSPKDQIFVLRPCSLYSLSEDRPSLLNSPYFAESLCY